MTTIFTKDDFEFKENSNAVENFRMFTASPRLWEVAKSENLIFDMRKLKPGEFSFPYHFHQFAEELMMIVSGELTVRSPDGFEVLKQGDIVFFEKGENGAHQFFNHTDKPCVYLDIRVLIGFDVCEYPDTGKINVLGYGNFMKDSKVEYFEGEENIVKKWKELKNNRQTK
ncbi:cupin domain-containing protein [Maribellus comscasis]|uniref:Cupin domain-containing protein n=1 Tax=Maribellus comscasis TaxID=2681766 RepID=A0A6I6JPS2_9BACT|nr:cupin domain-containing protein [Maribellus comscasis]QGY43149.1 cupin domain-containing protein [Maribellus comscasis]